MTNHRGSIRISSDSLTEEDRRLCGLKANKFEVELCMRFMRKLHVQIVALEGRVRAAEKAIVTSPRRARD
jgi:hypothetical protein